MDFKKKSKQAIREDVALLLQAKTKYKVITELTGASAKTIARVKVKLKAGESLKGKSHGGQNKKLTPEVLNEVKLKFNNDPSLSIRQCARLMGCNEKTIRTAREKLGMASKKDPLKITKVLTRPQDLIIQTPPLPLPPPLLQDSINESTNKNEVNEPEDEFYEDAVRPVGQHFLAPY